VYFNYENWKNQEKRREWCECGAPCCR
jgi:hypothetical protein